MNRDDRSCYSRFSKFRRTIILLLVVIGFSANQENSRADILLSAGSFSNLGGSGTMTGTSGTVSRSAGGVASWGPLASAANSSARFGVLKTYASASAGLYFGSSFASTYGINHTFFQDDLLFNAAGLTGTQGTVEVRFTVFGTLQGSRDANTPNFLEFSDRNAYAQVEYQLTADSIGTFSSGNISQKLYARGDTEGTEFLNVEQVYLIPFVFGTPINNFKLRVSNQASAITVRDDLFSSSTISDQAHTTLWGGFGAVRDASGNLVNDYSFWSASGFDYRNSVPEPGSTTLVASVVGVLCLLRRRRSGSSLISV